MSKNKRRKGSLTTKEFISKCVKMHGGKFDYSDVKYINTKKNIRVKCNACGWKFRPLPIMHMKGSGCPKCAIAKNSVSKEEFIRRAIKKHGDTYDYSKVSFINLTVKVIIICKIHGEFIQSPSMHIHSGHGCRKCGFDKTASSSRLTKEDFIKRANIIHNEKFNYSKINYIDMETKLSIVCPIHGVFMQSPSSHIYGKHGCSKCSGKYSYTTEEWVLKAIGVHSNKYIYDRVEYNGKKNKIEVKCKEHGYFKVTPDDHIHKMSGCPVCSASKGELKIFNVLSKLKIKSVREYRIQNTLYRYDFMLPELNILIEYDGIQHFKPIQFFGGMDGYKRQRENDIFKNKTAKINKFNLIRIPYTVIKKLDMYLIGAISNVWLYYHNNKYYRNIVDLCAGLSLPDTTSTRDVTKYLTYRYFKKMLK